MQFGGVIYSDSADKAARFIMNCNQRKFHWCFYKMLLALWLVLVASKVALLKMEQN